MDCSKPKTRKQNPREHANIFSIIFFKYVCDIFYTGVRRNLKVDDIYGVLRNYQANWLYNRMNKEWEKEKIKPNPSILLIFARMFGLEFVFWGVGVYFVICCNEVLAPILTGKLMSYFDLHQNVTIQDASLYAAGVIGAMSMVILLDNTYLLAVWLIGLQMQIACCTMIYRKCLKLNLGLKSENINGRAVTLITKDVMQLLMVVDCGHMLVMGFPRFLVMVYIMYQYIGVSSLVGAAFVFLMIPVNVYFGKVAADYRLKSAFNTDARVKVTQEILTAIRTVKMYTWEKYFSRKIGILRKKEIRELRILMYLKASALAIGQLSSRFALYACVMTYIALGNHVTAEKAFVVVGCFGGINRYLTDHLPVGVAQMAEFKASLHRITKFLMSEEVSQIQNPNTCSSKGEIKICVENAVIKSENGSLSLDNINLDVSKGLTVIMGPTRAGKSVLLKMILGEIPIASGKVNVCGDVSYASQEPWIFPSTIRQNIIFGEDFDENRYHKVIDVCALGFDLQSFPNGDQTYLTDRGLNLSKGQKARINLARAIYKIADIYLLDDCLSSVDSRVGRLIFLKCVKEFLNESICILVTHNGFTLDFNDNVHILKQGVVKFQNNFYNFKQWDERESIISNCLEEFQCNSKEQIDSIDHRQNYTCASIQQLDGTSTYAYEEFNQTGKVNKNVYYQYFLAGGGFKIFLIVACFSIAAHATSSWSDYFVSFWVDIEQGLTGFRLNKTTNSIKYKELQKSHSNVMELYSLVMLCAAVFTIVRAFTFFFFTSKASTKIHNSAIERIIKTGVSFFDQNLSGNVLNRLSRDLGMIDEYLPLVLFGCTSAFLSIFAVLFIVSSVNWFFIIPSAIFVLILCFARYLYLPTARNLRRLAGAARSPLIGHLSATLEGLVTIRANNAQNILEKEFDKHQDLFSSALYMNLATMKAFGFYIDVTGIIYISIITFSFLFFKTDTLAGEVGLAITQSFSLTGLLKWGIQQWAELESQMTSTERVLDYNNLEPENTAGHITDDWPNKGAIEYQNVNLRYSTENSNVLKDLNFYIESKEKVGIVGRTGAGKTLLISLLFRMYNYDGAILIDGIDIKTAPISYLRSKITIIPQDPVLFSGTIRSNLDPYFEYTDEVLWDALNKVELKQPFKSLDDVVVAESTNLSVGEKQLLCLARAIIRNNTILVLDEPTANLDLESDTLIQQTIKKLFYNCTVITIAHRLRTVIESDKIIVMDAAEVMQFGTPKELMKDEDGLFYGMVKLVGLQLYIRFIVKI